MPHLQFELNRPLTDDQRTSLVSWTTERYADVMDTGTGHVAVTIREHDPTALCLGRAPDGDPVGLLNADVRAGRSREQRHTFARAVVDHLETALDVPADHCYVVYTEHPGDDFVLSEGPLDSWADGEEDPSG
jgi:phenylpyruvate tautomerase PptA (4-oxalocrotonate tautomerase family)